MKSEERNGADSSRERDLVTEDISSVEGSSVGAGGCVIGAEVAKVKSARMSFS